MSTASTARAPKPKPATKRPRVQSPPSQTPNARQLQQLRQEHEQQQQYQHFQHLLQQQKLQHQSQQLLAELASGGKRRAPAAAAAAAARRTYIHHSAGTKTKLIELLVRSASELDSVASMADFRGAGRYLCLPATTSVLQLRKFLAARCSVDSNDLQLSLSSGMPADDRVTIARLEEYWVERGPAVVEMKLSSKASESAAGAAGESSSDAPKSSKGNVGNNLPSND